MAMAHRKFAASTAHRWLKCTASHTLESGISDRPSKYAEEGTRAHDIAAEYLKSKSTILDPSIDRDAINTYTDWIDSQIANGGQDLRIEFSSDFIPNKCGGTTDAVFQRKDTLHIVDFKYGAGVVVEPRENEQLMIYALACLPHYSTAKQCCFTIVQPRAQCEPIRSWRCGIKSLKDFESRAKMAIAEIEANQTVFERGDHCKFCKALHGCPAYLELIEDSKLKDPRHVLDHLDEIRELCNAVEKEYFERLKSGETVPGFKLVQTVGRSKWIADAMETLKQYPGTIVESLIGITEAKKLLGKEIVEPLTIKGNGNTIMVKDSDKRPAIAAGDMFETIEE